MGVRSSWDSVGDEQPKPVLGFSFSVEGLLDLAQHVVQCTAQAPQLGVGLGVRHSRRQIAVGNGGCRFDHAIDGSEAAADGPPGGGCPKEEDPGSRHQQRAQKTPDGVVDLVERHRPYFDPAIAEGEAHHAV